MRLEGSSHHDSPDATIDWLLGEDQPSVRYHTLVDLLGRNEGDPEVKAAHSTIPRVGWAHDLLRTQKPKGYWEAHEPRTVREWVNFLRFPLYNSSIWKGIVLSDLGLTATDPRVRRYAPWFRFHYPIHYFYDVLVGLDVMTQLGFADDRRLGPALKILKNKRQPDGSWLLDAVHPDMVPGAGSVPYMKKHKRFTLEAPGKPSKWITLTALRVLRRVEDAS